MKKDIHPVYHADTTVVCACGHTFKTGSTLTEIKTELCSKCHPFYTGKQKLVDSARRVEKFQAKTAAKAASTKVLRTKKEKRDVKAAVKAKKAKIEE